MSESVCPSVWCRISGKDAQREKWPVVDQLSGLRTNEAWRLHISITTQEEVHRSRRPRLCRPDLNILPFEKTPLRLELGQTPFSDQTYCKTMFDTSMCVCVCICPKI